MNTLLRTPFAMPPAGLLESRLNPIKRILVLDDESYIRQLTTDALLHSGYQADIAENGVAAWDALQLNSYDLLVTDNNMCRATGIGLVKKLHAARRALPVILVAREMPTEELKRNPWLKIDAALLRPFTTLELLRTVRQVLRATDNAREQIDLPVLPSTPSTRVSSRAVFG